MLDEVCTLCGGFPLDCPCGPPRPEPRDALARAIRDAREIDPVAAIHAINLALHGRTVGTPAPGNGAGGEVKP